MSTCPRDCLNGNQSAPRRWQKGAAIPAPLIIPYITRQLRALINDEKSIGKLTGRNGSYFLIIIKCDLESRKVSFSVDMPGNCAIEFTHINRRHRVTRPGNLIFRRRHRMANKEELAQMAHLMRRAGFGATREELEERVAKGYEATVEALVNPRRSGPKTRPAPSQWSPAITPAPCSQAECLPSARQAGCTTWSTPTSPWKRRWPSSGTMSLPPAPPR